MELKKIINCYGIIVGPRPYTLCRSSKTQYADNRHQLCLFAMAICCDLSCTHNDHTNHPSFYVHFSLSLSVCAFAICNGKRKFFHKLNGVVVVWVREQSDMFELDDENKYPIKFSIQKLESTLFKGRILFMFWFYAARDLIYHSYSYQIHIYFINFHPILSICWPSYIHVCWFAILFVCIYLLARLLADVICIL